MPSPPILPIRTSGIVVPEVPPVAAQEDDGDVRGSDFEGPAAEEAAVRRQGRRVHRLQDRVTTAEPRAKLLRRRTPEQEACG